MTPEQKARVVTQLVEARNTAYELSILHARESFRYRKHYENIDDTLKELTGHKEKTWDNSPSEMYRKTMIGRILLAIAEENKERRKKRLTNKKRNAKLNKQ